MDYEIPVVREIVMSWLSARDQMVDSLRRKSVFYTPVRKVSNFDFLVIKADFDRRLFCALSPANPGEIANLLSVLITPDLADDLAKNFNWPGNGDEMEAFRELVSAINTSPDLYFREV